MALLEKPLDAHNSRAVRKFSLQFWSVRVCWLNKSEFSYQWRIQGRGGRDACPLFRSQFFHVIFGKKFAKWFGISRRELAPPSGESWIRNWLFTQNFRRGNCVFWMTLTWIRFFLSPGTQRSTEESNLRYQCREFNTMKKFNCPVLFLTKPERMKRVIKAPSSMIISGSFRVSLFIGSGCPSDLAKHFSCFIMIKVANKLVCLSVTSFYIMCQYGNFKCCNTILFKKTHCFLFINAVER